MGSQHKITAFKKQDIFTLAVTPAKLIKYQVLKYNRKLRYPMVHNTNTVYSEDICHFLSFKGPLGDGKTASRLKYTRLLLSNFGVPILTCYDNNLCAFIFFRPLDPRQQL